MPPSTPLTGAERRRLKQLAHHLKPVVLLGQAGLTDAVLAEIELALDHHELIKVRINADERGARDDQAALIAARTGAALIQRIGHVASLYRANPARAAATVAPTSATRARTGAADQRPARTPLRTPARTSDQRPARPGAVERRPGARFNGPRPPNSRGRR